MNEPTTIGIDLAKTVFQNHGVNAEGEAVAGASFNGLRC
jgi:hypothetical protein